MKVQDDCRYSKTLLKALFESHADKGLKTLLLVRVEEEPGNLMASEPVTYTCTLEDPSLVVEAVKTLDEESETMGAESNVIGIFDLSRDFESQASRSLDDQLSDILAPDDHAALRAYAEECAVNRLVNSMVDRPWTDNWFKFGPQ